MKPPPVLPRTAVCGKLASFSAGDEIDVSGMCMMDKISAKRDEIYAIARKHKAEKLWVFGSCARREERPDSDVDFLVKFGKDTSLFDQGALQMDLGAMLGRSVDVIDDDVLLQEPYFAYTARRDMVPL